MDQPEIIYQDNAILVCLKPQGVLSTDEPGGLPSLLREALGDETACVRTVHRLDRVVGGLMVLARTPAAASELSRQVRDREFDKEYLAVVHGRPEARRGTLRDLLARSREERKTYVVDTPAKGVQEAVLTYRLLDASPGLSLVRIHLETGRTHQIRAQFAAAGHPLLGAGKYGRARENKKYGRTGGQALCSYQLAFRFTTDAGCLAGLNGRVWTVDQVDFVTDYFPHVPLHP